MNPAPTLDELMERASQALVARRYLECESACAQALARARAAENWSDYARILLPLQEARRQRRQVAASGWVRLGTGTVDSMMIAGANPALKPSTPLRPGGTASHAPDGAGLCVVVTRPMTLDQARAWYESQWKQGRLVVAMWADHDVQASAWTLRSLTDPSVQVTLPAPPPAWVDRWIAAGDKALATTGAGTPTPHDWFLDALQALGDAALAQVTAAPGTMACVEQLETALAACPEHEILHQRLARAAMALVTPATP